MRVPMGRTLPAAFLIENIMHTVHHMMLSMSARYNCVDDSLEGNMSIMSEIIDVSAVVALFMAMNGIQFGLAFALIGLLAVVVLNMWLGAKIATAKPSTCYLMLGFESVYTGALLGGTLQAYSPGAAFVAFLGTAVFFGGLVISGWITKKGMTRVGSVCSTALIVLIIVEIIMLFIGAPGIWMLLSAISIIIFAGLTLWDAQKLRGLTNDGSVLSENMSTFLALELYLDFVNLFMNILQLLGGRNRD